MRATETHARRVTSDQQRRDLAERANAPVPRPALEPLPAWAVNLTRWLDDFIRIPGTRIGFGLDALIGFLLPGVGDALTGIGSAALLWLALKSGVPRVVLLRMVMNIGLDALFGAIPLLGDLFDIGWKANRKNLELIERFRREPGRKSSFGDYMIVALGVTALLLAVLLPILVAAWLAGVVGDLLRPGPR
jgi:hypothetical protein